MNIRGVLLFVAAFFTCQVFAQSHTYCVKQPYHTVCLYDSSKTRIICLLDKTNFFYCYSDSNDWYSLEMAIPNGNAIEGWVHEDSIQLFEALPLATQKNMYTNTFHTFLQIETAQQKDTTAYSATTISPKELYYTNTFYPMLEMFDVYYKKSLDTVNLGTLFKFSAYADGEFSETISTVYFNCYLKNKDLFIRQLHKIAHQKYFDATKAHLGYGIIYYLPKELKKKGIPGTKIVRLVSIEAEKIDQVK
jgi:hypothetical protein